MFKKILVANRGEIALRVICACRELGIRTVAIFSEADRDSLHVRFADEAVCVGPAQSSESYLKVPSVISAAEVTDVDAVHPGYGYLAENAYFAEVCEACNVRFIGPSPQVIRLMGDKARARARMVEAGLAVLPGSQGALGSLDQALEVASGIGYPVIVKAAAGGGGRGMRIVRSPGRAVLRLLHRRERGPAGLRGARSLPGEVPGKAAPHRVPGDGGPARQGGSLRGAGVFHPAPPPEADRGIAFRDRGPGHSRKGRQPGVRKPWPRWDTPEPERWSSWWTRIGTSISWR